MNHNSIRALVAIYFILLVSSAFAQNKVVVIPLGGDDQKAFAGEATISIPITSLTQSDGSQLEFSSSLGAILRASGNTTFGTSIIIPQDHNPGTLVFVDIYVYNPAANGACLADIRSNYGRSWRPGEPIDQINVFGFATIFPSFTMGNQTYSHTYRFGADKGAEDSIIFGLFRAGNQVADNCGDVGVVGMNIRYERE